MEFDVFRTYTRPIDKLPPTEPYKNVYLTLLQFIFNVNYNFSISSY